jgi:hypothetical protein
MCMRACEQASTTSESLHIRQPAPSPLLSLFPSPRPLPPTGCTHLDLMPSVCSCLQGNQVSRSSRHCGDAGGGPHRHMVPQAGIGEPSHNGLACWGLPPPSRWFLGSELRWCRLRMPMPSSKIGHAGCKLQSLLAELLDIGICCWSGTERMHDREMASGM